GFFRQLGSQQPGFPEKTLQRHRLADAGTVARGNAGWRAYRGGLRTEPDGTGFTGGSVVAAAARQAASMDAFDESGAGTADDGVAEQLRRQRVAREGNGGVAGESGGAQPLGRGRHAICGDRKASRDRGGLRRGPGEKPGQFSGVYRAIGAG